MGKAMWELTVRRHFSAAHALREYQGACARLHGHNYEVEVVVTRASLDALGMVMDFGELKRLCDEVIDGLDHRMLNDLPAFSESNATSERIAEYIFGEVARRLDDAPAKLRHVRVWETPTSAATYWEE
jgi:6-pyruvoyltetrahydropterin/6-carboxytetrahydropterin synthase